MSGTGTIDGLEAEIRALSDDERLDLMMRINTLDEDEGDRALRERVENGEFDELATEASRAHHKGGTRPL